MPQHIGIAACSAEGAALCFRTICLEGEALMGEHWHPEVTMQFIPSGSTWSTSDGETGREWRP